MTFRQCFAFLPLAIYFLVIGMTSMRGRPRVVGGGRDLFALGLAISGLIFSGPIEWLLPDEIVALFRDYPWLLMGGLFGIYLLLFFLAASLKRPGFSIYNLRVEDIYAPLLEAGRSLDPNGNLQGSVLTLPQAGIQLQIESVPVARHVWLGSVGERQDLHNWHLLGERLAAILNQRAGRWNWFGLAFLLMGGLMLSGVIGMFVAKPDYMASEFRIMFYLD